MHAVLLPSHLPDQKLCIFKGYSKIFHKVYCWFQISVMYLLKLSMLKSKNYHLYILQNLRSLINESRLKYLVRISTEMLACVKHLIFMRQDANNGSINCSVVIRQYTYPYTELLINSIFPTIHSFQRCQYTLLSAKFPCQIF